MKYIDSLCKLWKGNVSLAHWAQLIRVSEDRVALAPYGRRRHQRWHGTI